MKLTERQQEAMDLRNKGLTLEQIGEQMATTKQNVSVLLSRAERRLKQPERLDVHGRRKLERIERTIKRHEQDIRWHRESVIALEMDLKHLKEQREELKELDCCI